MTVRQLIRALEQCKQDSQVHLAFQPNHPLKAGIHGIVTLRDFEDDMDDDDPDFDDDENLDDVWLVASQLDGYAPGKLWD